MLDPCLFAPNAVARWAAEASDDVAVEHVGGERWTYGELDESATRWAGAFASVGVMAGDRVATIIPNGPTNYACWLGLARRGAVEVPVSPLFIGDMLEFVLRDSAPKAVVVATEYLHHVAPALAVVPSVLDVIVVDGAPSTGIGLASVHDGPSLVAAADPTAVFETPSYRDIACVLYTSGTTGRSKGVVAPWALIHQLWSWVPAEGLGRGDSLYCSFQMFHNSGKACLNAAMARGARFSFRDRFSVKHFWTDVRKVNAKAATLVGPMTALLMAEPESPDDAANPLEAVLLGPLIPDIEAFKQRFGVRVATCYSQTEVGTPIATGWDHGPWRSCGRPRDEYPWVELRIVDEHDEPVATGVVGELTVRTKEPWALSAGYLSESEVTARAWRNGWFHTGDTFRVDDDGWYYLVDRLVDTIRRRGENMSSQEIEALVGGHPEVEECSAFAVPGEIAGDHEIMAIVALCKKAGGSATAPSPSTLHRELCSRMPRFMVPRYIEIVDELPRNQTTLRVRKTELRARGVTSTTWDAAHEPAP